MPHETHTGHTLTFLLLKIYQIYTDGSFRLTPHECLLGWAFIVVSPDDQIIHQKSGKGDISISPMRNIGVELHAVIQSILYMEKHFPTAKY